MEPIEKWWLEILSNEDFLVEGKILDFDAMNRVGKLHLVDSFNEFSKVYKPKHIDWGAKRLCTQFKKLVPFANDIRSGSTPREYEFPSLNDCKLFLQISTHLTVMYSKLTNPPPLLHVVFRRGAVILPPFRTN